MQVLAAIDDLDACLSDLIVRAELIRRRLGDLRDQRRSGNRWDLIVRNEPRPRVVELLATTITELHETSGRLRRAQAVALRNDGLTMYEIAALFGVTRQRVSELLRGSPVHAASTEVVGWRRR